MDAIELNEIMQSDMKLWDMASKSTNDKGQLVVKTELPHGIGTYEITFTGVTNGIQRRAAMDQWAGSIRASVKEAIGEEAVTARAQQAAAAVGRDSDQLLVTIGSDRALAKEVVDSPAVQTHEETLKSFGEDPADRLAGLRSLCRDYSTRIDSMQAEMQALTAYMEVMNVYEKSKNSDGVEEDTTSDARS